MPSAEHLKQFVCDKLAAAAEEIFAVFHNTIVEYEEELDRQRKLLDVAWRPVVRIRRTELPQQDVVEEELTVTDQSSLDHDRKSSVDQEQLELSQGKEQKEEVISSEIGLKEEPQDLHFGSADEELNKSENPTADWNPEETVNECEANIPVITSVLSVANSDLSLNPGVSQSQKLEEDQCENSKSTGPKHQESHDGSNQPVSKTVESLNQTVLQHKTTEISERPLVCPTCGKGFRFKSHLSRHKMVHTGLRPHVCRTCGKEFSQKFNLDQHQRIHTGEKPHVCQTCGRGFLYKSSRDQHLRIHTGERPYVCQTCGQTFRQKCNLVSHQKTHTGLKPFVCQTCGQTFRQKCNLISHQKTHTGLKPFVCQTCGQAFRQKAHLNSHVKIHTVEKPYVCQTCGLAFESKVDLKFHQTKHTGVRPFVCQTCSKAFSQNSCLKRHKCRKGFMNSSV